MFLKKLFTPVFAHNGRNFDWKFLFRELINVVDDKNKISMIA
jgi:hypothetical protein